MRMPLNAAAFEGAGSQGGLRRVAGNGQDSPTRASWSSWHPDFSPGRFLLGFDPLNGKIINLSKPQKTKPATPTTNTSSKIPKSEEKRSSRFLKRKIVCVQESECSLDLRRIILETRRQWRKNFQNSQGKWPRIHPAESSDNYESRKKTCEV